MGRKELSERENWQADSCEKSQAAEKKVFDVLSEHFKGSGYRIRSKPKELRNIYMGVPLDEETLKAIYTPDKPYNRHGIEPDFAIDNVESGKTLYGEDKRQNGWVEGKVSADGRGNAAQERACKYFTPGLQKTLTECGNLVLGEMDLPFWIVFQGDIARDPRRVRETHHWFGQYKNHFYFWRDTTDTKGLIDHFEYKLKHLLN